VVNGGDGGTGTRTGLPNESDDVGKRAAARRPRRRRTEAYYLPPYAPDLSPVEGIRSLLRGGRLSNVAFGTPEHLDQRIRRGLRLIQYRSHLTDGCLAETGLTIGPA
jgi:transposase